VHGATHRERERDRERERERGASADGGGQGWLQAQQSVAVQEQLLGVHTARAHDEKTLNDRHDDKHVKTHHDEHQQTQDALQEQSDDAEHRLSPATARLVRSLVSRKRAWQDRYQQNRAKICSFWMKGQCQRGLFCPYRHEKPMVGELVQMGLVHNVKPVDPDVAMRARYHGQTHDAATTNILNNLLASAPQSQRSHPPNAPLGSAAADGSTPRGADILPPVLQQMLSPQPSAAWSAASRGQPRNTMPLPFAPTLPHSHKPAHGAHSTWQHERAALHTPRASEVPLASLSTGKGGMLVAKWHARGTSEGGEVSEALLRDLFAAYGRVSTVRAVHKNEMAFVKFTSALDAEKALTAAATRPLSISGLRIHVSRST